MILSCFIPLCSCNHLIVFVVCCQVFVCGMATVRCLQPCCAQQHAIVPQSNQSTNPINREHVWALLGDDGFLAVPTTPGPAPLLNTPPDELNAFRTQLISVSCIASLCQLPQVRMQTMYSTLHVVCAVVRHRLDQVNIPLATVDGCPVGLGIIGPRNSDEALLRLTERLSEHLGLSV